MTIAAIAGQIQPHAMTGASMGQPPQQKMTNLFAKIDTANTGNISQAQFTQAFQTMNPPGVFVKQGSNAIWTQLDPNGTGSVSKQNFVGTMKQLMASLRAAS